VCFVCVCVCVCVCVFLQEGSLLLNLVGLPPAKVHGQGSGAPDLAPL